MKTSFPGRGEGRWMRVTLTKHRGHGAKPLSHENKEILSSFVRRCPYLRLPTVLFPSRLLSPSPFSFTYFYLRLFATVRIITPSLSLSTGHYLWSVHTLPLTDSPFSARSVKIIQALNAPWRNFGFRFNLGKTTSNFRNIMLYKSFSFEIPNLFCPYIMAIYYCFLHAEA